VIYSLFFFERPSGFRAVDERNFFLAEDSVLHGYGLNSPP